MSARRALPAKCDVHSVRWRKVRAGAQSVPRRMICKRARDAASCFTLRGATNRAALDRSRGRGDVLSPGAKARNNEAAVMSELKLRPPKKQTFYGTE